MESKYTIEHTLEDGVWVLSLGYTDIRSATQDARRDVLAEGGVAKIVRKRDGATMKEARRSAFGNGKVRVYVTKVRDARFGPGRQV